MVAANTNKQQENLIFLKLGNMEFEQSEQQLTITELITFENSFSRNIPIDFKEHYLKYNGGYPPYENLKGLQNNFTINGFYPIKYGRLPIEKIIKDYKNSGIDFIDKIPFAYDNGGNIYLISIETNTYGYVYILEVDFLEEKNYILVSKSFSDFLNSFY